MNTRNLALPTWDEGNTEPYLVYNQLLYATDALIQCSVEAITASPPSSPSVGQVWIVASSATDAWAGHDGDIALSVSGGWIFYDASEGWMAYVKNVPGNYQYVSGTWSPVSGGASSAPVAIQVAASDETTVLTTGSAKVTFRLPYAFTLTSVRASLTSASTSGNPAIDVNMNGSSIFSTTLTIDSTERTSVTAAIPAVISTTAMVDDAEITVDIDVAGTGAKGLKVTLIGTKP